MQASLGQNVSEAFICSFVVIIQRLQRMPLFFKPLGPPSTISGGSTPDLMAIPFLYRDREEEDCALYPTCRHLIVVLAPS
jgi:hypothetical protein